MSEFIEKSDAICAHCGKRIFWWALSHFWSHAEGDHMGLINCYGVHNPSQGIINEGPFAEPKEMIPAPPSPSHKESNDE